ISVDSISIFQELMSHNLIDEYWFLVHPLLSPKGKRLFEGLEFSNQLELTDTRKFKSGVVALHYRNIES
ncbi:MAG: dihydrofolate reductase family protein, partial [Bacteroidetes bacterium]|nr:dihydrofolate reductase family protein [Bacteroidota bacterium]